MKRTIKIAALAILLVSAPLAAGRPLLFQEASRAEAQGDYQKALKLYKTLEKRHAGQALGGEAQYRRANIYDMQMNNPPRAIQEYETYRKKYRGRNLRRVETRLKTLEKYRSVNVERYQEYLAIINKTTDRKQRSAVPGLLEKFIKDNPGEVYLDEALLWLAGEYRGHRRAGPEGPDAEGRLNQAIQLYERVVRDYPRSKSSLIALKNLGDCWSLKKQYAKADGYYKSVAGQGGPEGLLLVGHYQLMAQLAASRQKLYYVNLPLLLALLAILFYLGPWRKLTGHGLKPGLYRVALTVLPAIVILSLMLFGAEGGEEHHGSEKLPLIVGIFFVTLLPLAMLDGYLAATRMYMSFKHGVMRVTMGLMVIPLNYVILYHLQLLPHLEKYIV